ncbi:UL47 [Papiine alphaherpesvirus 2]|uniref:Tegument protein UL47 n=1 Tax=Cercopithecine herpesvirus 16 TaxID=340907 RepID=Q2QBC9_CHV16|nr:tegument protein VP13/14 [Papiine alphaherpesvirus 2]ABA29301.1 UL47 [Papiine alphaherpesvirus 2]UYB79333.1 tegument protein VP13/14 [synthetic construct]UYB79406.1 tegument protein VP13/14 [synthetic construct]UYB79480.1 tegument protein VP13/14 [Papiine alphaherpesvirus 2]
MSARRRRASASSRTPPAEDAEDEEVMDYDSDDGPGAGGTGIVGYLRSVFGGGDPDGAGTSRETGADEPPLRRRRESREPARRRRGASAAPSAPRRRRASGRPGPARPRGYLGAVDASELLAALAGSPPRFLPSDLFAAELAFDEGDYPGAAGTGAPRPRPPAKIEILEGRLPREEALALLPIDQMGPRISAWDESVHAALAMGNPACLYPCPHGAFNLAPVGEMHMGAPDDPAVFHRRTLRQGQELAWHLTGDALRELTDRQLRTTPYHAVNFLADAVVRVAANGRLCGERLHAEAGAAADPRTGELRRQFARLTALQPVEASAVPLLAARGLAPPQTGPEAAAFRSSGGSLAYWAELRALLDRECRVAVRHAARLTYVATGALLARVHPDAIRCLAAREAAFLGRVFDVLAVLAEQTVQWLSVAVGARLHPRSAHPALREALLAELFYALPLGSPAVVDAEDEAFGAEAGRRALGDCALNAVLLAAVYALHTALGAVALRHARAGGGPEAEARPGATRAAARAILAGALVLQRLLGFADAVLACLSAAAFDGGRGEPDVGAYTPLRYACVLRAAAPLYARTTPSGFWADVRAASRRIDLRPVASRPPAAGAGTVAPRFLLEQSEHFPPAPLERGASALGPRARVADIRSQFRRLLMGDEETAALRAHVSGRRAAGLPAR